MRHKTYIFFTSDNGPAEIVNDWEIFNSNGVYRGMKRDPYEGGIRVPFIIRGPGIPRNSVNNIPIVGYDLFPTFMKIAGIKNINENLD